MVGPGLKQHMRLARATVYAAHRSEAESRCSCLGLPAASPCPLLWSCLQGAQNASEALRSPRSSFTCQPRACLPATGCRWQWPGPDRQPGSCGEGGVRGSVWNKPAEGPEGPGTTEREEDKGEEQAGERRSKYSRGEAYSRLDVQTQQLLQAMAWLTLRHQQDLAASCRSPHDCRRQGAD